MARGPTKRVRLAREALTAVGVAVADGLLEVGRTIVETTRPPDSPLEPYPLGQGLPLQGGVLVYLHGQKVAGWSQRGLQPKKPRNGATPKDAIVALVGFGFPGGLKEGGTLHDPPHPFLSPATDEVTPHIPAILAEIVGPALAKQR